MGERRALGGERRALGGERRALGGERDGGRAYHSMPYNDLSRYASVLAVWNVGTA
jgi:hypothetical protein